MHKGKYFNVGMRLARLLYRGDRRAPFIFDQHRRHRAYDVFFHAPAKHAINAHQHLVARFDQIGKQVSIPAEPSGDRKGNAFSV